MLLELYPPRDEHRLIPQICRKELRTEPQLPSLFFWGLFICTKHVFSSAQEFSSKDSAPGEQGLQFSCLASD